MKRAERMCRPPLDAGRLQSFAENYVPCVLDVINRRKYPLFGKTPEEYAVEVAVGITEAITCGGVASVEHYDVNARGGALAAGCRALGLEPSAAALETYLRG